MNPTRRTESFLIIIEGQPLPAPRPRVVYGKAYNDPKYTAYKEMAALTIKASVAPKIAPYCDLPLEKDITIKKLAFHRKGQKRADIDNLCKTIGDALELSGLIKNDNQITKIKNLSVSYGAKSPRIELVIML